MIYRLSTSQIYANGINNIQRQQFQMNNILNEITTGKKPLSAYDKIYVESHNIKLSRLAQTITNAERVTNQIELQESNISAIQQQMLELRDLTLLAKNTSVNNRAELEPKYQAIKEKITDLVNTRNQWGDYIFSGYQSQNRPFPTLNSTYNGDGNIRNIEIARDVYVEINSPGNKVITNDFQNAISELDSFFAGGNLPDSVLNNIDNGIEATNIEISKKGLNLNKIESFLNINKDLQINFKEKISNLEDVDLADSISRLNQAQTALQASLKSYAIIQDLSLWDYI